MQEESLAEFNAELHKVVRTKVVLRIRPLVVSAK